MPDQSPQANWTSIAILLAGATAGALVALVVTKGTVDSLREARADAATRLRAVEREFAAYRSRERNEPQLQGRPAAGDEPGQPSRGSSEGGAGSAEVSTGAVVEDGATGRGGPAAPPGAGPQPPPDASRPAGGGGDPIADFPDEFKPEMLRYRESLKQHRVFGEAGAYVCRIQPITANLFYAERGGMPPAGRSTPETVERQLLQGRPIEEREEVVRALWGIIEEENHVLAELASASQRVVNGREAAGKFDQEVLVVELRRGKVYVVRRGEDPDVDRAFERLQAVNTRRAALVEPYLPTER